MKEKIVYYRGTNPLVAIPAFSACTAHLVLVIKLLDQPNPTSRGFGDIVGSICFCLFFIFLLFLPLFGIFNILINEDEPTVAYASKQWVRGIVSLAIVLGVGTFLMITAALRSPELKTVVDSLLLATSVFSLVPLIAHIALSLFVETTSKLKPERSSPHMGFFYSPLMGLYGCLVLFLRQHQKISTETGEASFALLTLSGIAFLWFEDRKTSIADREIVPLCLTSILWMGSALLANYAYGNLASVTFALPYLVYFLPIILLGFYYYVSAPEES